MLQNPHNDHILREYPILQKDEISVGFLLLYLFAMEVFVIEQSPTYSNGAPKTAATPAIGRNLTVTVSNFILPLPMVYTTIQMFHAQLPTIAKDEQSARRFTQKLVSEAIRDVLLDNGRRVGLPDFVTTAILDQIEVQITYEPLRCAAIAINPPMPNHQLMPIANMAGESCFIVGDTVSTVCPSMNMAPQQCRFAMGAAPLSMPVPEKHLRITGTIMVGNAIMATWSNQQWQTILNRGLRLLQSRAGQNFAAATIAVS